MPAAAADVNDKVRATRAYLAGFGTSGSLLAGAALMFVLASAIVAFRGWPQVTAQNPVVNVAAPRLAVAASTRTGRILDAALGTRSASGGAPVAPGTASRGGAGGATSHRGGGSPGSGGSRGTGGRGSSGSGHTTVAAKPTATCVLSACSSNPTVPPPVKTVTGSLTQTLSQTASQVDSTVNNVTTTAASQVPPVGNAVQSAGQTTSTAINTVTTTASAVVGGLTK